MVPLGSWAGFAALAVVIIAIPGPSVLFTISRALTVGRRSALFTVAGNALGVSVQVVVAAFGLGAVVEDSAVAFSVLRYLGAAYIVYLGVQAVVHRDSLATALGRRVAPVTTRRAVRDGLIVGVTNPKTIVVLVAVLPGFTDPAAGHLPLQLLLLGLLFPAIAVASDSLWALAAGTARAWLARSPRRMAAIGGSGGLVMIGIGASLAFTGRKD
jgi:threonine/homoserine/homoserine lactone efflux protein